MKDRPTSTALVLGTSGANMRAIVSCLRDLGLSVETDRAKVSQIGADMKCVVVLGSPLKQARDAWRESVLAILHDTADRARILVPEAVTKETAELQLQRIESFFGARLDDGAKRNLLRSWTADAPEVLRDVRKANESAPATTVLYAALLSSMGITADFDDDDFHALGTFDEQRRSELLQAHLEAARAHLQNEQANHELYALTSSRAWKSTMPLRMARRAVGQGIRALKRSKRVLAAEPLLDARESQRRTQWRSEGGEPEFSLVVSDGGLPSGWVLFELTFKHPIGGTDVTLFADYSDTAQTDAVRLPAPIDGRIAQVLELKPGLTELRLRVAGAPGSFVLADVTATEITSAEAAARLSAHFTRSRRWTKRDAVRLARKAFDVLRKEGLGRVLQLARGDERFVIESQSYADWIERFEHLSSNDVARIKERIDAMQDAPVISIIVPVFNTSPGWLRKAIDSVRSQLYPHWELCIADDASTSAETIEVLREYAKADERIKVVFREKNGHISQASNSALERATGRFVALLDHDDELAPHALYMVAEAISANPDAGLIYSDEDKIDEAGNRYDPHFKPDWNPELFLGQNFISHLGVYRRTLVSDLGGFRVGMEGSQDYDLALRVSEKLKAEQIVHIPWVLYHWRSIPGSTALASDEKNYAFEAAGRALSDHVRRTGLDAVVEKLPNGLPYHRVKHAGPKPRVAIIIPTKDRVDLLSRAIDSIAAKTDYTNYEIIVVDNRSVQEETHAYFRTLEESKRARVLPYDHPFNYSALNNFAARQTDAPILALLNNDVEVISTEWLSDMVSHAVRQEVGCVGAMLYYPDDRVQHAGVILGINGVAGHTHRLLKRGSPGYFSRACLTQALSVVTAACLVVRHDVYDEVGGLDETLKVAFNDVDFCLRVRERGYRNVWTPHAELYHYESATRGPDTDPKHRARFASETAFMKARWGAHLTTDPAYNPNLSLVTLNFSIAQPPRTLKPWTNGGHLKATGERHVNVPESHQTP